MTQPLAMRPDHTPQEVKHHEPVLAHDKEFISQWTAPVLPGPVMLLGASILLTALLMAFQSDLILRARRGLTRESFSKLLKLVVVCVIYMIVGPALMVLNKEILQTLHFPNPLTLSCMGLATTAIVIRILVAAGVCEVRSEVTEAVTGNGWCKTVLPISLAKAMTLACGNAVYMHLGLGFIQMLKCLTPVVVVVVLAIFRMPLPGSAQKLGLYLIIAGTFAEVKGELNMTVMGLVLMMTSEICEAINLVMTQKLLHNCSFTLVESVYVLAPPSALFLLLASALMEGPRILRDKNYMAMVEHPFYFLGCCVLGLTVNFIVLAVIQVSSSLTAKVLNTIRGVGVIMFGVIFYNETCTSLELFGYTLALIGFTLYNCAPYLSESSKSDA